MLIRAALVVPQGLAERVRALAPQQGVHWTALSARAATAERIVRARFDVALVPRHHRGKPVEALARAIRAEPVPPELVVLTDGADAGDHASLLAAGCMAVVDTSLDDAALGAALESLLGRCRDAQRNRRTAHGAVDVTSLRDFVAESAAMRECLAVARRVVDVDSPVLVLGETGVGKEYLARAIHNDGPRASGPFVSVNCGALPDALFEGELFGHEEGAFTGASHARRGAFELAHGGTLVLDEIGDLPLHLQVKLLRVLQDGRIRPVGGEQELELDVRVIAATNRDLVAEVQARRFRADLFYRLDVVSLTLPPLRARREDIPALVESEVRGFCARFRRPPSSVDADALRALVGHDWPGNVRELHNALERAVLLCDGGSIGLADLPPTVARARTRRFEDAESLFAAPLREAASRVTEQFEREYLARLIDACDGRLSAVAARAGISPRGLYGKLRRLGLAVPTKA